MRAPKGDRRLGLALPQGFGHRDSKCRPNNEQDIRLHLKHTVVSKPEEGNAMGTQVQGDHVMQDLVALHMMVQEVQLTPVQAVLLMMVLEDLLTPVRVARRMMVREDLLIRGLAVPRMMVQGGPAIPVLAVLRIMAQEGHVIQGLGERARGALQFASRKILT